MARIRTIKPEFFRHHDLYLSEIESKLPLRVAFAGLWTAADREGRFKWDAESLKLDCLPYDKLEFSRVLDALVTRGFIEKYASNGREYGWIPSFSNHQVINNRERDSILPNPLDASTSTRAPRVHDACPTPLVQDQGEGKGRERKGKEGDRVSRVVCPLKKSCNGKAESCQENFEKFWAKYPRHEPGKSETMKSWCKVHLSEAPISDICTWLSMASWSEKKFIPHATTFLNQRRWEGDLPYQSEPQHDIYEKFVMPEDAK